jgi:hypothetical protein
MTVHMDPDAVAAAIHRALESTTIMQCRTTQVGSVAVGVLVFPSSLPQDKVDELTKRMNEVGMPDEVMAAILVRSQTVSVAVHRVSQPMAKLIGSVVTGACEAETGEPPLRFGDPQFFAEEPPQTQALN